MKTSPKKIRKERKAYTEEDAFVAESRRDKMTASYHFLQNLVAMIRRWKENDQKSFSMSLSDSITIRYAFLFTRKLMVEECKYGTLDFQTMVLFLEHYSKRKRKLSMGWDDPQFSKYGNLFLEPL